MRERGSALVAALLVIVIISMIASALFAATTRTRQANRTRADRVQGLGPSDTAVSMYRFGLQAGVISDMTKWVPDKDALEKILGSSGKVIPNNQLSVGLNTVTETGDGAIPASGRYTAQLAPEDSSAGSIREYWQIYRATPPSPTEGKDLTVVFRAWSGPEDLKSGNVSNPRYIEATYRQGRFSDFQMISNGPIKFDDGSILAGPVHSNGQLDGITIPPPDRNGKKDIRIFSSETTPIQCPAQELNITTSTGSVDLPGCRIVGDGEPTGKYLSIQGLDGAFASMSERCDGSVVCFSGQKKYTVSISGSTIFVNGISQNITGKDGLLFDGNVELSSNTPLKGRLSIGAINRDRNGNQIPNRPAATITINNSGATTVGPAMDAAGKTITRGEALGLFAQGDIILNPSNITGCPQKVHGVLISGWGSVTIGRNVMTSGIPNFVTAANPHICPRLTVSGAMIGSSAPMLRWQWPSKTQYVGFAQRTYLWDPVLRELPPPFVPTTGSWEAATWRDADQSSLAN